MPSTHRRVRTPGGAIFSSMALTNPVRASLTALVVLLSAAAPGASASSSAAKTPREGRSLLQSRQLWATIDVCNPADQPDAVGIRGSMPGNGRSGETMYMRFRLQYLDSTTKRFVDLAKGTAPRFVAVGPAQSARQSGRSFQLVPVPGRPAFTLRGVVTFQWRRSATVVESVSRPTTAGHMSLAGADPPGFSAATCSIG
jgi:hypothetical protein